MGDQSVFVRYLLPLIFLLISGNSLSEPISIEAPKKSFFASSDRTQTVFYPASEEAKATIIFLPGGDGYRALNDTVANTVATLSKSSIHVVVVDSPYPLTGSNGWLSARFGNDHLDRVESVIAHYSKTVATPIWLMGHSLGAASALNFANRSEANRKSIAGLILSGSRGDINLNDRVSLPILFFHHIADGCAWTSYPGAMDLFERVQKLNDAKTRFVTIEGGMAHPTGDPCNTGFHMYLGASSQFLGALRKELGKFIDGNGS